MVLTLAIAHASHAQVDIRESAIKLLIESYRLFGMGVKKALIARVTEAGVRAATIEVGSLNETLLYYSY
jgi:4-hydroxy-3-methylbut-2-en-1-yl diphosphate synthase IspG/GcpE